MDNTIRNTGIQAPVHVSKKPAVPAKKEEVAAPATDSVSISGKEPKASEKAEANKGEVRYHQAYYDLDDVGRNLSDCKYKYTDANSNLNSANYKIQDAGRDLNFAGFPIRNAERDTKDKDVSNEGYRMDSYLRSAQSDVRSGENSNANANRNLVDIDRKLQDSLNKLRRVSNSLTSQEEADAKKLVDKSIGLLGQVIRHNSNGNRDVVDADREIKSANSNISGTTWYVSDIKRDRVGVDVSSKARQVGYQVDRAEWDIRDTERYLRNAGSDVGNAKTTLDQAIRSVNDAKNALRDVKK